MTTEDQLEAPTGHVGELLADADVLALMRVLSPVVEHRRHYGLNREHAEVYARTVLAAGYLSPEQVAARIRAEKAEALRRAKAVVTAHGDAYLRDAVGGDSTLTVGQLLDDLANLIEAQS